MQDLLEKIFLKRIGVSNMAVIQELIEFPIPEDYPCPIDNRDNYVLSGAYFRGYSFKDSSYGSSSNPYKGVVLYFHGSGAGEPKETLLTTTLCNEGYIFIAINDLNLGISGMRPEKYGYGNVNDPQFTQRWILSGWWVRSVINYVEDMVKANNYPVVLIGHSMGAAGVLAYLAGYTGGEQTHINDKLGSLYRGCLANGATIAGLGNNSWNDITFNINQMSQMMRLAQEAPSTKLIVYADNDSYAPPEYVKFLESSLASGKSTYVLGAGNLGHSWFNIDHTTTQIVASWVDQLMNWKAIRTVKGLKAFQTR